MIFIVKIKLNLKFRRKQEYHVNKVNLKMLYLQIY